MMSIVGGLTKMSDELEALLKRSKEYMDSLTPEQRAEIFRKQGESWARSEAQWAKDYREGKCERD